MCSVRRFNIILSQKEVYRYNVDGLLSPGFVVRWFCVKMLCLPVRLLMLFTTCQSLNILPHYPIWLYVSIYFRSALWLWHEVVRRCMVRPIQCLAEIGNTRLRCGHLVVTFPAYCVTTECPHWVTSYKLQLATQLLITNYWRTLIRTFLCRN